MKRLNNKGFSLVEMMGVIAILGIFLLLAIPTISNLLIEKRKQAYLDSVIVQKNLVEQMITSERYNVYDKETVYYFDYALFSDSNTKGKSPFGDWKDCYVVVTFDGKLNHFYWTGMDTNGWKIDLRKEVYKLKTTDIYHSSSYNFIPGNTIGGRDNVVIYKAGNDEPIEQTPSNDVSYADAVRCFGLEKLSDGTYSIINYNTACGTDVGVPSSVDGVQVTVIGENAFRGKGLTSVNLYYGIKEVKLGAFQDNSITSLKLASTVKTVGDYAFYRNSIEVLDLPDGVETISSWAFANNNISSISFPKTLKTIGSYAFYGNRLNEIELKSNPSMGGAAFSNNKMPDESALIYEYNSSTGITNYAKIIGYAGGSKNVVIPASVNGVAPTTIASNAFASCSLNSVVIPDTVTSIGYAAFYSNNLQTVTLPSHLTSIGQEAFRNNKLSSINIPNTVTNIGIAAFAGNCFPTGSDLFYKKTSSGAYDYTTIMSTGGGRCGNTTLNIPAKKNNVILTTIPSYAMMCSYYTTINLPDLSQTPNLTIGNNAFYQNDLPKSSGFMYKVTNGSIDYSTLASYGGKRGGELVIPEESHGVKLKTINASFSWSSFSKITIPSSVVTISGGNFPKTNANNTGLVTIVNKTGRAFDWYQLTGSSHANPGPFVTGTVSHQSGDIKIVAN